MNEHIRISPIRLIGAGGEQLGLVPTAQALEKAREAGLRPTAKAVDKPPDPTVRALQFYPDPVSNPQPQVAFIWERSAYTLRCESHTLTTGGVAMQFDRFSKSRAWLEKMGVAVENPKQFDETATKMQANQLLIFSRWCQVMLRFEKSMYEKPDQDLNKLWWGLIEKYQQVKRPPQRNAPDYASKIHIVSAPVYYHNYQMGQLFASKVHHAIAREVYKNADPKAVIYVGDKRVGDFMKQKVFEPGRTLSWNGLTKHATGEELNAKAFAADFKGK